MKSGEGCLSGHVGIRSRGGRAGPLDLGDRDGVEMSSYSNSLAILALRRVVKR